MIKKIILITILILTTGCWDKREIKDLAIANSLLFDYKDGKVIALIEIVNPKTQSTNAKSGSAYSPYTYIRGEDKKLLYATDESTFSLSKILYTAHIKAIFITEAFAKEKGFSGLFDLLIRYPELRQNEYVVVVRGTNAEYLYKSTTSLSDYFGDFVDDSRKGHITRLSSSVYTTFLEVIRNYYASGTQAVMGVINIEKPKETESDKNNPIIDVETKENLKVKYEGAAIFKEDKLKYFLTEKEARTYNLIKQDLKSVNLTVEDTMFKVIKTKTKIKTKFKNNKVTIDIEINPELMVFQEEKRINFLKTSTIKKLQKKVNIKLKKDVAEFVTKSQKEIKIDFLDFGRTLHIENPKTWKKIKKKWDSYFYNAKINIKINTSIVSSGKVNTSVKREE